MNGFSPLADARTHRETETAVLVLPERRMGAVADMLVEITAAIDTVDHERTAHGFLGGAHGYGAHWSSDTFQMRPFCWCESEACPWCMGCDCPSNSIHYFVDKVEVAYAAWQDFYEREVTADIHTSRRLWERQSGEANRRRTTRHDPVCGYCLGGVHEQTGFVAGRGAPNFWHKPSGLKVWWYKYIGRGDEAVSPSEPDLLAIRADCLADIEKATTASAVGTKPKAE